MRTPEIALVLCTYQRPWNLRNSLLSIACQQGVEGLFELIVADDGSQDETREIVEEFAAHVPFRVHFTTHPHGGFRLSMCRNEGAAQTTAPYLLFLDGDCILPADHVRKHLDFRRANQAAACDCIRLDQPTTRQISDDIIRAGSFATWGSKAELRRLAWYHRKAGFYNLINHPRKPMLIGNNIALWRKDYERVNGFDERFQGWGCEDNDLTYRLKSAGVRIRSILGQTHTFHLWHPPVSTAPMAWRDGPNVPYLLRKGRLTRCRIGLVKRALEDLELRVLAEGEHAVKAAKVIGTYFHRTKNGVAGKPEVEVLVLPGKGRFSGHADCNVLVQLEGEAIPTGVAKAAHVIVSDQEIAGLKVPRFRLCDFDKALNAVA